MTIERFVNVDAARARFGERVERLGEALLRTDPLADAAVASFADLPAGEGWSSFGVALQRGIDEAPRAPAAVRALFAQVDRAPMWLDRDAAARGGAAFLRSGLLGGLVLGAESLVLGYVSPGGNKPLVFSGRLQQQASRRLGETARFVHAVSLPGGMRRHGDGFAITVKVRLVHAQVRRLVRSSGKWRTDLWGEPINQHDMAGTTLLFSLGVIDGLDKLGFRITSAEAEDIIHLWSYVAYLMGLDADLIPRTVAEATALSEMIKATQGPPDQDSRDLVHALLLSGVHAARSPAQRALMEKRLPVAQALCRRLIGDELADALAIPRTPWRFAMPAARAVVSVGKRAIDRLPFSRELALAAGNRYWEEAIAQSLAGAAVDYTPPERLGVSVG